MEETIKIIDFLPPQGVGSLGSAWNVGANAGPTSSSSYDCRVEPVDQLTGEMLSATSENSSKLKMEKTISIMMEILNKMQEALKKQPNVSRVIKGGLPQITEHLECVLEEVQIAFSCDSDNTPIKKTQTKKQGNSPLKGVTSSKRLATSPLSSLQNQEKK